MAEKLKKITPEKPLSIKERSEAYYPEFHLELKDVPEVKKWEIGSTHRFIVEVDFTSISEGEDRPGRAGFKIKKVKVLKRNLKKELANMVKGGK